MKRCPECRRDYFDDTLSFCLEDGTPLVHGVLTDEPATAVFSTPELTLGEPKTDVFRQPYPTTGADSDSIAVLPFANISADADNEYFCDGLAEELLNALAKITSLTVAARTSAFSFKGKNKNVAEIGAILGVKYVLEGSVRKSGNQLRIIVQLVNAVDGYHLWSDRYDRELQEIFEVQDDITSSVIDALKIKLTRGQAAGEALSPGIAAYELYLKGRYHLAKMTPPDLQKSIDYFLQATERNESYALAFAGLSEAYLRISIAAELPPSEFFPKSKAAARRATEIDPSLGDAYVALAWNEFWYDWNWGESEKYCRRAVQINSHNPEAHIVFAHLLSNTGRHQEALDEIRIARRLDPLSLLAHALEGQILLFAGQPNASLTTLAGLIELEPRFWIAHLFASGAYSEIGKHEDAVREARIAGEYSGGSTQAIAFEICALTEAGKRAQAFALFEQAMGISEQRYVPPYHLALMHHALGDVDAAIASLKKGLELRDVKMVFLKVEPKWNDIRSDIRLQGILAAVGSAP